MSRHIDEFVTKILVPRRRADTIRRERLLDILYGNLDHRLTVVHAPAGYGKTTLPRRLRARPGYAGLLVLP